MTAQAAIGNPRVFVDHTPSLQERYTTIVEHLQLAIAYEIRFNQILEQYPNNPNDPILQINRTTLHNKKSSKKDILLDKGAAPDISHISHGAEDVTISE